VLLLVLRNCSATARQSLLNEVSLLVELYIAFVVASILLPILYPFISWALGRWYQGRLMAALDENEKMHGVVLSNESLLSTSSRNTNFASPSATLLHVSLCVAPSTGQIFFMWVKSLFGGRLVSYDVVLDYGRREALYRLQQQARQQECTSMINIRIETSTLSFARNQDSKTSSIEILAYATGLRS